MKHDRAAPLIADYALGRLDDADRDEVGGHIARCEDCRELLEQARELREVLGSTDAGRLLAHVQSRHLTRYALDPASMDGKLTAWIARHVEGCAACREAVDLVREPEPAVAPERRLGAAPAVTPDRGGLWRWLERTILHPAPALAYLVLLAGVGVVWVAGRAPTGIEVLAPAVPIYPVEQFRSEGGVEPRPIEITLDATQDLHLQVHTDIEDALREPNVAFRLEIRSDDDTLVSRELVPSDLSEFGVLGLRVPAKRLESGRTYRITLRLDDPDSPRDGDLLFDRSFRVSGPRSGVPPPGR